MNILKFPSGWFDQSTFKRENGFRPSCQRNLLNNLSKNGSVETRNSVKGNRIIKLYRQIQKTNHNREFTYSSSVLHNLFGLMGMNEMTSLTTETQPV